jgi:hypothetical protein
LNVRWLFWLTVAAANQVPNPGATSQWRNAAAGDITNLQSGAVIEEARSAQWPQGTAKATIQAAILAIGTARQAQITAMQNPNLYYGGFWDSSTGWSF